MICLIFSISHLTNVNYTINMALKYLPLIVCFLIFLKGAECPERFVEVDGVCYFKKHLDVLQDFIDLNPSINGMQPQNIGYQEWTNNQLTYLYLGENNIATIPDSIGLLKGLINFDLRENQIFSIPEEICNIYPFYTEINLSGNQICPPYPYCFEYIGNQNIKGCDAFDCPRGYMDVDGECYNKEHVQILQSIIDINPSLNRLSPLDLGKDIGRLGWENGKLISFDANKRGLSGGLPQNIGNLDSVLFLYMSDNHLNGELPNGIYTLMNLQSLHLAGNQLNGEILPDICLMLELDNWETEGFNPNRSYLYNNKFCPDVGGYPDCIVLYMGVQDSTGCNP